MCTFSVFSSLSASCIITYLFTLLREEEFRTLKLLSRGKKNNSKGTRTSPATSFATRDARAALLMCDGRPRTPIYSMNPLSAIKAADDFTGLLISARILNEMTFFIVLVRYSSVMTYVYTCSKKKLKSRLAIAAQ